MRIQKPLVLCIAGPTATGKTDVAVAVCKALGGEVISMDSMQIYQNMAIGTAMPTPQEMQGVPHHMLSIIPPDGFFTVFEYQQQASDIMRQILDRKMLPVFCGGTGLYLQAITHPLSFTQAGAESAVRIKLERESELPGGKQALFDRLMQVDPDAARLLHPNNARRVIRALEVFECTGMPMSAQTHDWDEEAEQDFLVFALNWPREILYQRINHRVDQMIHQGLIDEVKRIGKNVAADAQSMQAIGYREIGMMLMGECTEKEAIELIKRNTRRYAKRQLTWLRRDKSVQWIDRSMYPDTQSTVNFIIHRVNEYRKERVESGGIHDLN